MGPKEAQIPASLQPPGGDRFRLLPFNRRIRHLQGISLRNLRLDSPTSRARRKTIDDDALPSTLKSSAKLLAAAAASEEVSKLAQSRSFTDLKSQSDSQASESTSTAVPSSTDAAPQSPDTSRALTVRRKSTLEWMNASPNQWKHDLQYVLSKTTADIFFSLHCPGVVDPIYISEVAYNTSNTNYRFFDLRSTGASISRQDSVIVNLWTRKGENSTWQHHRQVYAKLRSMHYLAKSLEENYYPLPENCVIFHLQDGVYTSLDDVPTEEPLRHALLPGKGKPKENAPLVASEIASYDALMRLSTIDQRIQESLATRRQLSAEIENLLENSHLRLHDNKALAQAKHSLAKVQAARDNEAREVESLKSKIAEQHSELLERRGFIQASHAWKEAKAAKLPASTAEMETLQSNHRAIQNDIRDQRRRICTDLCDIFPIDPVPGKILEFKIRGLALPNSVFTKTDIAENAEKISAALGHVAQVVYSLMFYLEFYLPYPLTPRGSVSSVYDPISISISNAPVAPSSQTHLIPSASITDTDPNRRFPLYITKSSPFYRFEYGVFLLNKNIELLAGKLGLRILDIRQTLANLKYILYVATAGEGELPMRKAGGVRGLLHANERTGSIGTLAAEKKDDAGGASPRPGSSSADTERTITVE